MDTVNMTDTNDTRTTLHGDSYLQWWRSLKNLKGGIYGGVGWWG